MIDVGIIGVSGYTGLELVKLLINHPKFNIKYLANNTGNQLLEDIHPSFKNIFNLEVKRADILNIPNVDLIFLALPHKSSMQYAKEILKKGIKVVDLSADYRLELETYEKHYTDHSDIDNLKNAVYGLPEIYKQEIKQTNLVANPGCYPTASILGISPFLNYIDSGLDIFIDAKSSPSGAGKKLTETTSYMNVEGNTFIYSPLSHRHSPEIKEKIDKIAKDNFKINFVPSIIPSSRGMLVNIYATLKKPIDAFKTAQEFYKDQKMVRVNNLPVNIKNVAGTNFCDIFAMSSGKTLVVSSVIDNLLRGASSQAVVNANLMMGLDEDLGINHIAYMP